MHLAVFALLLTQSPLPPPPATGSRAPPAVVPGTSSSRLVVKVALRARGSGASNAAMRLSALLVALSDSLREPTATDSTPGIALERFGPEAGGDGKAFEARVAVSLTPRAFPKLVALLGVLATGDRVELTDLRLGGDDPVATLADQMVRSAVDSGIATATARSTGSKLASLALLLLAIRREVRQ